MSDRCAGLEALEKRPAVYLPLSCGVNRFSIPLRSPGHLVGFVPCGQVRLSNDAELVDILNVDDRWQDDPALVQAFRDAGDGLRSAGYRRRICRSRSSRIA
ncbi:PocR ligand-binding domain-containing protein [Klebsiella pneumoniae]|nr:PocR ligand-binding domain-containing protein [Klebsiella pneumoniae]